MNEIRLSIPGIPVSQPRPRARAFAGKVHVTTAVEAHPVHAFKARVALAVAAEFPGPPHDGAIGLTMLFVLPRPASKRWKKRPMPRYPHTTKPDLDNLAKAVLDALTGVLFNDDRQVFKLVMSKCVANGDESPHTELVIWDFATCT